MEAFLVSYKEGDIVAYLQGCYPEEGCGILLNKRVKLELIPCNNDAEDPYNDFKINTTDYVKAQLMGDIYAIVHSHVDASPEPSEADIKSSDFLGIPYIIYSIPSYEKYTYTPVIADIPLTGRTYNFGENDCYSLVRDYYRKEFDITLPSIEFEDNWWDKGLNYFEDCVEPFGFKDVDTPQKGDMIIFKVYGNIPNHCGIYLEEDVMLHHAENRLSCRESLYPFWIRHLVRFIRYAKS